MPDRASASYVPLWCKSNYSFLEGASHPEELVEEAHRLGIHSLALSDRDGVYGIVRAHKTALELGVHLIVGSEITLADDSILILLAMNREGYANLCRLISKGRLRCAKGSSRVEWKEVCQYAGGLIALWGGERSLIAGEREPEWEADQLREAFGDRLYAMLTRHREAIEVGRERRVRERAGLYGISTVAGMEVLYHTPERRPLQDVLTCIRHGVRLSTAGRLIRPNAEHALRTADDFARLYSDDLESVRRCEEVASRCTFSMSEIRYRYPSERLPSGMTSSEWLRKLALEGAQERFPETGVPKSVRKQVEKELSLIRQLDYDGYFLTMWEIVRYCRKNNILCQGRGSAANSAVCYCLGVTAVDPTRINLLFERFLSLERAEPPDIDLDIEHDRREEVIQHVYGKYGRTHAAMVANFIRYRAKSAIREVGKVLGIPEVSLEQLARDFTHFERASRESFQEKQITQDNRLWENFSRLVAEIQDVPRHLSIHPGGFLLGHEPVHDLVPIENATMPDRTVIQWDKEDVENLGLFKVDLLGLGALNVVHRSFDLIEKHWGEKWTLATIPEGDQPTYDMIQKGDTVGVFQIESRAQMSMLPRLKPRNYYDLVIEVSIVRPGPISGGMVHPYLRRRDGLEPESYPHPCLEKVLKKTLGVPLFQEQVIQLAVEAADYTPGEADQLRRDMAAWRRSGKIEHHRRRLVDRMVAKGIAEEFAERVFEQIRGFGEYGFPESHAASFALIAYGTSWLKCHYPVAFLGAMLDAQPMGFYSPSTLVEDAKRHGVVVRPIDVRFSEWDCTVEVHEEAGGRKFAVRMGLRYVKGIRSDESEAIITARENDSFTGLGDFSDRTRLNEGSLERLAESGALEGLKGDRREALWDVLGFERQDKQQFDLQSLEPEIGFDPLNSFETITWDYDYTSHSARGHPLAPLREELSRRGWPDAETVRTIKHGSRVNYAGVVICRQRPGTAKGVVFMTLEDETGFVNLVVWQKVFERYRIIAKTAVFLGVSGRLQSEAGVVHVVVDRLWIPDLEMQPEKGKSRDFH